MAAVVEDLPFTIVRVRGSAFFKSDQIASIETPFGAFGMCVISEQASAAFAAGGVPAPYDQADWDGWFVWQPWECSTVSSTGIIEAPVRRFDFDSKAMRKIKEGDQMNLVVDNQNGAHAAEVLVIGRLLIKLH